MLRRQRRDIRVRLRLRLLHQALAAALIEPRPNPPRQRPIAFRRHHRRLASAVRLRIVLLHRSLARGQLLLNLAPLVSARARQVLAGIVHLVCIDLQLALRHVQVVAQRVGRRAAALGRRRHLSVQALHCRMVVLHLRGQPVHLLLQVQRRPGQHGFLHLRLPQRHRERLVHLMVRQPFRLPRNCLLFR
jgi:hypothetical protein